MRSDPTHTGRVRFRFTDRSHGNLGDRVGDDPANVSANRQTLATDLGLGAPQDWVWLHQEHTTDVVLVNEAPPRPPVADGAITTTPGLVLVALAADCAPILLLGDEAVGVLHGGWVGLEAGIVAAGASVMRSAGVEPIRAILGPCARPDHYEFGPDLLERFVAEFGPAVASRTIEGTPALDIPGVVRIACEREGFEFDDLGIDTIASANHFSHRREGRTGRQGLVAWMES